MSMVRICAPWGTSKDITPAAYSAAKAVLDAPGATHWKIWRALVDAGTPIRGGPGSYPASQAATILNQALHTVTYV